jgi:hypothetical protein
MPKRVPYDRAGYGWSEDIMQFDCHREERTEKVRPELLAETRKHKAAKLLRQIPCIGRIHSGPYCVKQSPNS